ncbi:MAG: hypothetical protein HC933_22175 [Pleurocapsa sp. SU_196_0]|nr:hypothetical protein [Pleurocapsa sp. SU_196_0]
MQGATLTGIAIRGLNNQDAQNLRSSCTATLQSQTLSVARQLESLLHAPSLNPLPNRMLEIRAFKRAHRFDN